MSLRSSASVVLTALVLIVSPASAQYMGDITFSEPSGSHLPIGHSVDVEFTYGAPGPNGVRIWAYGLYDRVKAEGCTYSGSAVIPAGSGTLTRTFQLGQAGEVDHVRLYMMDAVTADMMLMIEVPLYLYYGSNAVHDITMSRGSPALIKHGSRLDIDFSYATDLGAVRISARPQTGGAPTPGYAASATDYCAGPAGAGSQYFFFDDDADVDAVDFRIYTTGMSLLDEFIVPVDLHWRERGVWNVAFTPELPACVAPSTQVRIDFDYESAENVYVVPYAYGPTGVPVPLATQPHQPGGFPAGLGSAWTDFMPSSGGEYDIASIAFRTFDLPDALVDVRYDTPAKLRFDDHPMSDFVFTPGPVAILAVDQHVDVAFRYYTDWMGGVRIYARPFRDGAICPDYSGHGSSVLPVGSHGATGWFTLTEPGHVDQVRFQMVDPVIGKPISEWFVDVDFHFGGTAILVDVPETMPEAMLVLEANRPNPFNPATTIPFTLAEDGRVRLRIFDARGRLVAQPMDAELAAGRHEVPFTAVGLPSGAYFYRVEVGDRLQTRKMMLLK